MNRLTGIISLVFAVSWSGFSATYYISSSTGDDTRTVTQAQNQSTPWQTLSKISSVTLVAGDQVLLKRGDTFPGGIVVNQSGSAVSPITYGAYGTGNRPVVSGAVAINGWLQESGRYAATYTGNGTKPLEQLFTGETALKNARFPNSGYITIDSAVSSSEFFCTGLIGPTDWTGAAIHVRSERWSLDARKIASFTPSTGRVVLDRAANYEINKGEGIFINNALAALDNGEWFYDSLTKKVSIATTTVPVNISGSIEQYGVNCSGKNYVTIDNIVFLGHTSASIRTNGASHITISNCDALYCDGFGMSLSMGDSRVEGCVVAYANVGGISLYGARNVVTTSTIKKIGMIDRLNRKGLGGGCCSARALDFSGNNNTISDNVLDSIGYVGIGFGGQNNLIERNVVQHICMTTDDGAAIYTWSPNFDSAGSQGTIIRKNVVANAVGAPEGTGSTSNNSCQGIYMDDRTHHVRIDSNTIFNNYLGIFLHNNRNHTVTGNVCYGNWGHQIQISRDAIVSDQVYGNLVTGNIFYATSESQGTITQTRYAQQDSALVTLSNNYTVVESPFSATCLKDGALIWKKNFVSDSFSTIGTNKIPSGEFDQATLGWGCWPSQYFVLSRDTLASPDKKCLKIRYFGDPAQGAPIVFANATYQLDSSHLYRLRFSAKEDHAGQVNCFARMAASPYTGAGLNRTIDLDTAWKDFDLYFEASMTNAGCRVDFYMSATDTNVWFDNMSLYEIDKSNVSSELRSRLFYNTAATAQGFSLGGDVWRDVPGATGILGNVTVQSFLSRILIKDSIGTAGVFLENSALHKTVNPVRFISGRHGLLTLAVDAHASTIKLTISDVHGRVVAVRSVPPQGTGTQIVKINAVRIAHGVLIVRQTVGLATVSRKVLVGQ